MARRRSRVAKARLRAERATVAREQERINGKAEELKEARRAAGAATENGNGSRRNGHEPLDGWFCAECGQLIPLIEAEAHEAGMGDRRLDYPHQDLAAITRRSRPWYEREAFSSWQLQLSWLASHRRGGKRGCDVDQQPYRALRRSFLDPGERRDPEHPVPS
jgi:hypothetical protein